MVAVGALGRIRPSRGVLRHYLQARDPALSVDALGMTFPSPLGVAAGMDKHATSYEGLGAIGFGFVEVGTITAEPQIGEPERVWRLIEDRGLLNALGFPNPKRSVAERLRKRSREGIVGVNVGKSRRATLEDAADDYRLSVRKLLHRSPTSSSST